ncbi:MAG TPA: malonyl-CoA decarboxylase family protein [Burkholderiales bacterium]|nr:malonyl-CoA decarboxylase family protein [Burkholderiales bacterium]
MFRSLFTRSPEAKSSAALRELELCCRRLLSGAGAANGAAIAAEIIRLWAQLAEPSRAAFFDFLASIVPERQRVLRAAQAYAEQADPERILELQEAVESPRRELLRRLSRSGGGVATVVAMRRELLRLLPRQRQLRAVDADFSHLLATWFNPGFLDLRQVDWNSPAALLEKIIRHEAVHAIHDWGDLRRRLQSDRRCFAFFHPQLPGEPLIFVEVALVSAIPRSIAQLIGSDSAAEGTEPRVAAFYSISNCEPGLKGVSLGNFLIKRVAEELRGQVPSVKRYCTLSPVPGLRKWLAGVQGVAAAAALRLRHGPDLERLAAAVRDASLSEEDQKLLASSASVFLARHGATPLGDPVARFHLDNGARLERINLGADLSDKGLAESLGVMVNYLYDLAAVEANHERFAHGEVVCSRQVLSAARA